MSPHFQMDVCWIIPAHASLCPSLYAESSFEPEQLTFTRQKRDPGCRASRGYFDACLSSEEETATIVPDSEDWAEFRPTDSIYFHKGEDLLFTHSLMCQYVFHIYADPRVWRFLDGSTCVPYRYIGLYLCAFSLHGTELPAFVHPMPVLARFIEISSPATK